MRRKSQDEFVSEVAQSLPDIRVEGAYVNSRTKVAVSCVVCGYEWQANPFDLIYGHGCPRCAGKERKIPERFESEIAAANPGIELIDSYRNTSTKMLVRCRTCRFEWLASPSTLRVGIGCPSCGGTLKKDPRCVCPPACAGESWHYRSWGVSEQQDEDSRQMRQMPS